MFGKKDNSFISRMKRYEQEAIEGRYSRTPCPEEIVPMIKALTKKSIKAKVEWDGSNVCQNIEKVVDTLVYLVGNTRNYEKIEDEEVASLKKIFEELDALHEEVVSHDDENAELSYKIECINRLFFVNLMNMQKDDSEEKHENWRDGMIFQNYENLWKVIHRVNTEWEELRSRGFSMDVISDYERCFSYSRDRGEEMPEEKRLETVMELLDGKMKFVPVYRRAYQLLGFKVMDLQSDGDEIIQISEERGRNSYRLRQEGEEITQCEVTEE